MWLFLWFSLCRALLIFFASLICRCKIFSNRCSPGFRQCLTPLWQRISFFFPLEFYDTEFSGIIKCRNKTLSLYITLKIALFFLNFWFCEIVVLAKLLYLCCLCIFLKSDESLNIKPVVTLEDPVFFVLTNSSYT